MYVKGDLPITHDALSVLSL